MILLHVSCTGTCLSTVSIASVRQYLERVSTLSDERMTENSTYSKEATNLCEILRCQVSSDAPERYFFIIRISWST